MNELAMPMDVMIGLTALFMLYVLYCDTLAIKRSPGRSSVRYPGRHKQTAVLSPSAAGSTARNA
jgi:hypothetical protein